MRGSCGMRRPLLLIVLLVLTLAGIGAGVALLAGR